MVARVVGAVTEEVGRAAVTAAVAKSSSARLALHVFTHAIRSDCKSRSAVMGDHLIINEALSETLVSRTYV